jgi:hypothetical protein
MLLVSLQCKIRQRIAFCSKSALDYPCMHSSEPKNKLSICHDHALGLPLPNGQIHFTHSLSADVVTWCWVGGEGNLRRVAKIRQESEKNYTDLAFALQSDWSRYFALGAVLCSQSRSRYSRGAEIKLPTGAGAEITNCNSGSGSSSGSSSFLFTSDLEKFYLKNHGCWRSFCKLLQF